MARLTLPQLERHLFAAADILRGKMDASEPKGRKGKVLFINADREYFEGRVQNYLYPEHLEKIVSTWAAFEDVPAFARVVSREALRENDDNLNIRRYADNAPPPEPHDVRAHLHGGVPKSEVAAKQALFDAHGLDPRRLFKDRDDRYFDFGDGLADKGDLKKRLDTDAGMARREQELTDAVAIWWKKAQRQLAELPETRSRASSPPVVPAFLEMFFETTLFFSQLGAQSAGTGLKHIHLEHFREFRLAVPPLDEQRRILSVAGALHARVARERETLSKVRRLKQGLMEDLLTGRVRVTNLLDEAAA